MTVRRFVALSLCLLLAHAQADTPLVEAAALRQSSEALRKAWLDVLKADETLRTRLGTVELVIDATAVVRAQAEEAFGRVQVSLSQGWLDAIEQLLWADEVSNAAGRQACLVQYRQALRDSQRARPREAVPVFAAFARSDQGAPCWAVPRRLLHDDTLRTRVRQRFDDTVRWTLAQLNAQHLPLPTADQDPRSHAVPAWVCDLENRTRLPAGGHGVVQPVLWLSIATGAEMPTALTCALSPRAAN